jgi:hypothetical protein
VRADDQKSFERAPHHAFARGRILSKPSCSCATYGLRNHHPTPDGVAVRPSPSRGG